MNVVCRNLLAPLTVVGLSACLGACTWTSGALQGDKIDYKTEGTKTVTLDVPPDLTQLARDSRYQPVGGTISASTIQGPGGAASAPIVGVAASAPGAVAPNKVGDVHLERAGAQRWLVTQQTPEQLWPQLQAFWQERGFQLTTEQKDAGLMETNWAENRAKLPQDFIRTTIGRVFDSAYDTGERDMYRTRLERSPGGGTEVYITHRGMIEVYDTKLKDSTMWQPRAPDPELEAVMLSRLMLKLGGTEEPTKATVQASDAKAIETAKQAGPTHARLLPGGPGAGLQVDDNFDRAWRRVGLALDRNGFTVEDRDRSQGLYFVRYVDPAQAAKGEPGFFSKLFGGDKGAAQGGLARYRIAVKAQGEASTVVTVLNNQGGAEAGEAAQRILDLLNNELK